MFPTFLTKLRAACVTAIVATGTPTATQAAATTFVGSIGSGALLQMLIAFFNNPADVAGLEAFIQFIVSLFAASAAMT